MHHVEDIRRYVFFISIFHLFLLLNLPFSSKRRRGGDDPGCSVICVYACVVTSGRRVITVVVPLPVSSKGKEREWGRALLGAGKAETTLSASRNSHSCQFLSMGSRSMEKGK